MANAAGNGVATARSGEKAPNLHRAEVSKNKQTRSRIYRVSGNKIGFRLLGVGHGILSSLQTRVALGNVQ